MVMIGMGYVNVLVMIMVFMFLLCFDLCCIYFLILGIVGVDFV